MAVAYNLIYIIEQTSARQDKHRKYPPKTRINVCRRMFLSPFSKILYIIT